MTSLLKQIRELPSPWICVTAGAHPQRDGTMSPPMWHCHCKWCDVKATVTQWKHPKTEGHPENDCLWIIAHAAGQTAETHCSNCGQPISARACGISHAILTSEAEQPAETPTPEYIRFAQMLEGQARIYENGVGSAHLKPHNLREAARWLRRLSGAIEAPDAPADTPAPDEACEHGAAMDVHCCNCHSGYLCDTGTCVCNFDERPADTLPGLAPLITMSDETFEIVRRAAAPKWALDELDAQRHAASARREGMSWPPVGTFNMIDVMDKLVALLRESVKHDRAEPSVSPKQPSKDVTP